MVFRISRLALDHFRSWNHVVLDFAPGMNVLVGKNGIGKTNLIEAIEFLSSGASHRASASKYLIQRGEKRATIRANVEHGTATNAANVGILDGAESPELSETFRHNDADGNPPTTVITAASIGVIGDSTSEIANENSSERTLEVTIPQRGAIRSRVDSGPSRYFRDIAGQVKVVVFSPRDQQLVSGDPAQRRGFLDTAATLMFPNYYALLQRFRQIAKQRTAVLKHLADAQFGSAGQRGGLAAPQGQGFDEFGQPVMDERSMALTELEVWTSQFIDVGVEISRRRRDVVERLSDTVTRLYGELSDGNGVGGIAYEPSFDEILGEGDSQEIKQNIAQHFQRIYPGEVARGSNLIGPHRDDLLVTLDGEPAREFASNGELWTLGLALKMAQFDYLAQSDTPILVLDDVFAQLDESRRRQILDFAAHQQQVFITVAAHSDIPSAGEMSIIDVEAVAGRMQEDSPEALMADFMRGKTA
ncbi:MAG: DNA replication and repair protein RecF [Bifidobacteriaceae bacterium]|jgi:DNA replication and repair protein RecF|nr:DNA replication and repair protein RecF [Bifidobacteriaceae bacterium]